MNPIYCLAQVLNKLGQVRTSVDSKPDPIDDITCMKIGFSLFHQHGKLAETLKVMDIISSLESAPSQALTESRDIHWCWNNKNLLALP